MPGTFKRSWQFFGEEVFVPLAMLDDAPPADMFAELGKMLLVHVSDVHRDIFKGLPEPVPANKSRIGAILSGNAGNKTQIELFEGQLAGIQEYEQQDQALEKLKNVSLPEFVRENDVISYIEKSYNLIAEYKPGWANFYSGHVSRFVWKFGLGYEVRPPFAIRPLITAEFARLYQTLKKEKGGSGDLWDLLGDFEHSYALFAREKKPEDLNNALTRAFSYLEGLAGEKLNSRGASLGDLSTQCERNGLFPHKGSIAKSLSNLYGFPSNYPRLRHAGNPRSKIRDLIPQDCIALSLMALLWAGYINEMPLPPIAEQDNQEQERAA